MERQRAFNLKSNDSVTWHSRNNLSLGQGSIQFHELHPNFKRGQEKIQRAAEIVIFDIIRNNSREKVERLEIMHKTEEK